MPTANEPTPKLLLTRSEAAATLSISVRTLDALLARGELPTRRLGRRRLIARTDLERFIKRDHATDRPMRR
jgi:excisionase family DNA binding protein